MMTRRMCRPKELWYVYSPKNLGKSVLVFCVRFWRRAGRAVSKSAIEIASALHGNTHEKVARQQLAEKVCFLALDGLHDEVVIRRGIEQRATGARIADLLERLVA